MIADPEGFVRGYVTRRDGWWIDPDDRVVSHLGEEGVQSKGTVKELAQNTAHHAREYLERLRERVLRWIQESDDDDFELAGRLEAIWRSLQNARSEEGVLVLLRVVEPVVCPQDVNEMRLSLNPFLRRAAEQVTPGAPPRLVDGSFSPRLCPYRHMEMPQEAVCEEVDQRFKDCTLGSLRRIMIQNGRDLSDELCRELGEAAEDTLQASRNPEEAGKHILSIVRLLPPGKAGEEIAQFLLDDGDLDAGCICQGLVSIDPEAREAAEGMARQLGWHPRMEDYLLLAERKGHTIDQQAARRYREVVLAAEAGRAPEPFNCELEFLTECLSDPSACIRNYAFDWIGASGQGQGGGP